MKWANQSKMWTECETSTEAKRMLGFVLHYGNAMQHCLPEYQISEVIFRKKL